MEEILFLVVPAVAVLAVLLWPKKNKKVEPPEPLVEVAGGTKEEFTFEDSATAAVGSTPLQRVAPHGRAIVQGLNASGAVVVMDTLKVKAAPKGPLKVKDKPATYTVVPRGPEEHAQQVITVDVEDAPFAIPPHMKQDEIVKLHILWSCHDE